MSILVFGKTGQVARELSKLSIERNLPLHFLSREDANLTMPDICKEIILRRRPIAVINAAAWTSVDSSEDHEDEVFKINATSPGVMAQACKTLSIPFLHISSDYVFSGAGDIPWKPNDNPGPINIYGRSKLLGEELIKSHGDNICILRTSWVFSSHGSNFVKTIQRLAKKEDVLSIVCDQFGGPTSARSIANAIIQIIYGMLADKRGGIFHFSGKPDVSWAEFAKKIVQYSGLPCQINEIFTEEYKTKALRPLNSRLNGDLLKEIYRIERPFWITDLKQVINEIEESF